MKKFITALVSFLLAGAMSLSLAACGNGNDNTVGGNQGATGGETGGTGGETGGTGGETGGTGGETGGTGGETGGTGGETGGTGGETESTSLEDAIKATYNLDNLTLNETSKMTAEVKYDGETMDPAKKAGADPANPSEEPQEFVYGTLAMGGPDGMPITFSMLAMMMSSMGPGATPTAPTQNPFDMQTIECESKFDYANGKIADGSYSYATNNAEEVYYTQYCEAVTGATGGEVKIYGQGWDYQSSAVVNMVNTYYGYADEAAAKAALKTQVPTALVEYLTGTYVVGDPEDAENFKTGTVLDLLDQFTLGADGKTYSAPLLPDIYLSAPFEYVSNFSIKVENGKVSAVDMKLTMSMDLETMMGAMGSMSVSESAQSPITWAEEGEHEIAIESSQIYSYVISDIGSTTVGEIPAERKTATPGYTSSSEVITDWKAVLDSTYAQDGTVRMSLHDDSDYNKYDDYYVNTSLGLLLHEHYEQNKLQSAKLYRVSGTELKTYEAVISGEKITDWGEPTTETIAGDVLAEFKELLPEDCARYFSIVENYDEIYATDFTQYAIDLDGKVILLNTSKYHGKYYLGGFKYYVKEAAGNGYWTTKDVTVNTDGSISITEMNLPRDEGEAVTATEWSKLTEGWDSTVKSLTETGSYSTTYISWGENGVITVAEVSSSGEYYGIIKHTTYTPTQDEQYHAVEYAYKNKYDEQEHKEVYRWVKREYDTGYINIADSRYVTEGFYFPEGNKTLAEMTAKYDELVKGYRISDESNDYVIRFKEGGVVELYVRAKNGDYSTCTVFSNKNSTTVPALPDEAQNAETEQD